MDAFPIELWTRIAARRLRRATRALLGSGDVRGYAPLREAIVAYLGGSRGVRCTADQVVIVSGVQQGLDLLARLLEGHLGRHIRRMRELYRIRLAALREAATAYLAGLLEIPSIEAGLNTAARVVCGLSSRQAEAAAAARGVDAMAVDRYTLDRRDLGGLLLGFGAFDPVEIRAGVLRLSAALAAARDGGRDARRTPTTHREPHDTRA